MLRILLSAIIVACIAIAAPPWIGAMIVSDHNTGDPVSDSDRTVPQRVVSTGGGRRVDISADARGHFLADVRINGRRVEGLIDTGASLVALNRSTARRLGVSVVARDFRHPVATANGTAAAARVTLRRVEVQSIRMDGVEALVLDDEALGVTLIGMSFLNRLTSFQAKDGTLTLRR